jgi:hypothetical protein
MEVKTSASIPPVSSSIFISDSEITISEASLYLNRYWCPTVNFLQVKTMFDKFAKLRAIESGQAIASTAPNVRFWNYEKDGNIMGTIVDFNSLPHPVFGEQRTVIVSLAESDELVSAFLSGWLQEGLHRKQAAVGDLILIMFFGRQAGERFNRYYLEIEKVQLERF